MFLTTSELVKMLLCVQPRVEFSLEVTFSTCCRSHYVHVVGHLAYTLSVRLSTIVNPLACLLVLFVPLTTVPGLSVLVAFGSVLSAYLVFLAALSPAPPLQHDMLGVALVVRS